MLDGREIKDFSKEEVGELLSLVYQNPEEMFIQDSIGRISPML